MRNVFVSILHFGSPIMTIACLKSLEKARNENIKLTVVIIDNDSKNRLSLSDENFKLNIRLFKSDQNLGFTGGHNKAMRHALDKGADYIMILNNDVVVDENLIVELIAQFDKTENVGIVSPKIYFTAGREFHKERYKESDLGNIIWYAGGITDWKNVINSHRGVDEIDHGQFEKAEDTDFATGACMMIKREIVSKIGVFDKRYFLYYEDADFNMRIRRGGYRILFVPKGKLWHSNAGSSSSGSELQDYYITRNRMLFGMRYAPLRSKLSLIKEGFRLTITGRRWQKIGARDYFLKRFGRGSYAI